MGRAGFPCPGETSTSGCKRFSAAAFASAMLIGGLPAGCEPSGPGRRRSPQGPGRGRSRPWWSRRDRGRSGGSTRRSCSRGRRWSFPSAFPCRSSSFRSAARSRSRKAISSARENLADAGLRAPFGGIIARRLVENFANVQAKEPIAVLQKLEPLSLSFDVPGPDVSELARRPTLAATAVLDGLPGEEVPATLEEFSTQADPGPPGPIEAGSRSASRARRPSFPAWWDGSS